MKKLTRRFSYFSIASLLCSCSLGPKHDNDKVGLEFGDLRENSKSYYKIGEPETTSTSSENSRAEQFDLVESETTCFSSIAEFYEQKSDLDEPKFVSKVVLGGNIGPNFDEINDDTLGLLASQANMDMDADSIGDILAKFVDLKAPDGSQVTDIENLKHPVSNIHTNLWSDDGVHVDGWIAHEVYTKSRSDQSSCPSPGIQGIKVENSKFVDDDSQIEMNLLFKNPDGELPSFLADAKQKDPKTGLVQKDLITKDDSVSFSILYTLNLHTFNERVFQGEVDIFGQTNDGVTSDLEFFFGEDGLGASIKGDVSSERIDHFFMAEPAPPAKDMISEDQHIEEDTSSKMTEEEYDRATEEFEREERKRIDAETAELDAYLIKTEEELVQEGLESISQQEDLIVEEDTKKITNTPPPPPPPPPPAEEEDEEEGFTLLKNERSLPYNIWKPIPYDGQFFFQTPKKISDVQTKCRNQPFQLAFGFNHYLAPTKKFMNQVNAESSHLNKSINAIIDGINSWAWMKYGGDYKTQFKNIFADINRQLSAMKTSPKYAPIFIIICGGQVQKETGRFLYKKNNSSYNPIFAYANILRDAPAELAQEINSVVDIASLRALAGRYPEVGRNFFKTERLFLSKRGSEPNTFDLQILVGLNLGPPALNLLLNGLQEDTMTKLTDLMQQDGNLKTYFNTNIIIEQKDDLTKVRTGDDDKTIGDVVFIYDQSDIAQFEEGQWASAYSGKIKRVYTSKEYKKMIREPSTKKVISDSGVTLGYLIVIKTQSGKDFTAFFDKRVGSKSYRLETLKVRGRMEQSGSSLIPQSNVTSYVSFDGDLGFIDLIGGFKS